MRPSRSSSVSSATSGSSSPSEDTHHIFVKLLSGDTIPLSVPSSTPIHHLQHLLSLRTSLPASSIRLVHAGRHLTESSSPSDSSPSASSLSTLSIPQNSTLHLLLPILGGTGSPSTSPTSPPPIPTDAPASATTNTTNSSSSSTPAPITPKKPKRNRCTFHSCTQAPQRIVGDCSFCGGHYCGRHRMLEDHRCSGLEDCKQEAHERNKEVLEGQKTVAVRGI